MKELAGAAPGGGGREGTLSSNRSTSGAGTGTKGSGAAGEWGDTEKGLGGPGRGKGGLKPFEMEDPGDKVGGTDLPTDRGPKEDVLKAPGLPGGKKAAAGGAAAAVAPVAAQAAMILIFINWLKMMAAMAAAVLMSIWQTILGIAIAVGKAVVKTAITVGTAIAHYTGLSAIAGTLSTIATGTVAVVSTVAIGIGGAFTSMREGEITRHDKPITDCVANVRDASAVAADKAQTDTSAQTEANAQKVYSIMASWGMSNENIAGILGNWSAESGIDPTSVETIFDEPQQIGPRKKKAQEAKFDIHAIDASYAARFPAIKQAGIGLGQWTNGRNVLLVNYAGSRGIPWHALETQIGFMISEDDPARVAQIQAMVKNQNEGAKSVSAATDWFRSHWEGITDGSSGKRQEAAGSWFAKMGSWKKDSKLADSVLAQAGASVSKANQTSVSKAAESCKSQTAKVNNSSLATAAISYAWAHNDEGKGNDGTDIYKYLHKQVLGESDNYFASCDRTMATAVRWSGTDDNYPNGGVSAQLEYVQSHPEKWQKVTEFNGDKTKLQPGDILLRTTGGVSHTVMWVGEDAVKEVWGEGNYEPQGEIVSGSLNDRSPSVGQWYTGAQGLDTDYVAYRAKGKQENSKFAGVTVPAGMEKGKGDKNTRVTPGP